MANWRQAPTNRVRRGLAAWSVIAAMLAIGLAACGSDDETPNVASPSSSAPPSMSADQDVTKLEVVTDDDDKLVVEATVENATDAAADYTLTVGLVNTAGTKVGEASVEIKSVAANKSATGRSKELDDAVPDDAGVVLLDVQRVESGS